MSDLILIHPETKEFISLTITGQDGMSGTWEVAQPYITQALQEIYSDMLLLKEGIWQPDGNSCDATLDNIELIAQELQIPLTGVKNAST